METKFSYVGDVAAIVLQVPVVPGSTQLDMDRVEENVRLVKHAVMAVRRRLYVLNVVNPDVPLSLEVLLRMLQTFYSAATHTNYSVDTNVLLSGVSQDLTTLADVEVVLGSREDDAAVAKLNTVRSSHGHPPVRLVYALEHSVASVMPERAFPNIVGPHYANACVGGTFDRLHGGHKLLLTAAALVCTRRLTVGITGAAMLTSKRFSELIHPFSERAADVTRFLKMLKPALEVQTVELHDMAGPAATDASLSAIVASPETLEGARAINHQRGERGLSALAVVAIDFVEGYVHA